MFFHHVSHDGRISKKKARLIINLFFLVAGRFLKLGIFRLGDCRNPSGAEITLRWAMELVN